MSWPLVQLGEIFDISRGGSPRPISDYITDESDGLNWISIKDASNSTKYITNTKQKIRKDGLAKSRLVEPGDFLLTNSMSFGRPYIMKTTGCIHDGWLVLTGDQKVIDSDYFYHLFGSDSIYRKFSALAAGAVVKNLNIDLVKSVEVSLPALKEQKRIAAILDKADTIRRKRQQAIQLADDFLRATFLDMFGDVESSEWQITTVKNIAEETKGSMRTGPFGSQLLHSEFVDSGILVLGIDNAVENRFKCGKPRFISEEKYEHLKRYTVKPGDVLITIMGTCGRCAVVPDDIPLAISTKHLCCITLDRSKCLPSFLHAFYLYHPLSRRYLNKTTKGAIMDGLNMGIIKEMPFPVVPVELQKKYDEIAKKVVEALCMLVESELCITGLFSSLSQKAFAGKL